MLFNIPASTFSGITLGTRRLVIEQQSDKATKSGLLQSNLTPIREFHSEPWFLVALLFNSQAFSMRPSPKPLRKRPPSHAHRSSGLLIPRPGFFMTCRPKHLLFTSTAAFWSKPMPGQPFGRPSLMIQCPFPGWFLPGSTCFISLRLHTRPPLNRAISIAPALQLLQEPTYAFAGSSGLTHISEIRPLPNRDRWAP